MKPAVQPVKTTVCTVFKKNIRFASVYINMVTINMILNHCVDVEWFKSVKEDDVEWIYTSGRV